MKNPFENELPPFLTNIDFENEGDLALYNHIGEKTPNREYVKRVQEIRARARISDSRPSYKKALKDRAFLFEELMRAEIKAAEMEMLAMMLDLKMCLLVERVREPRPGYFEVIGVSPVYGGYRKHQENQEQRKAELKARLRVISGGQE